MKSVNVRQLKNNPSNALKMARKDLVVVMNRDQPEAVLIHLDDETLLEQSGVRTALAVSLFKDGSFSLGRAAKLSGMALVQFIQYVSRLGIPVIQGNKSSLKQETKDLEAWLKKQG